MDRARWPPRAEVDLPASLKGQGRGAMGVHLKGLLLHSITAFPSLRRLRPPYGKNSAHVLFRGGRARPVPYLKPQHTQSLFRYLSSGVAVKGTHQVLHPVCCDTGITSEEAAKDGA